jgi:hypothetical protein
VVVRNGVALRKIFISTGVDSVVIIGIIIDTRGAGRSGNLSKDFRNKGKDKCCLWSVAIIVVGCIRNAGCRMIMCLMPEGVE